MRTECLLAYLAGTVQKEEIGSDLLYQFVVKMKWDHKCAHNLAHRNPYNGTYYCQYKEALGSFESTLKCHVLLMPSFPCLQITVLDSTMWKAALRVPTRSGLQSCLDPHSLIWEVSPGSRSEGMAQWRRETKWLLAMATGMHSLLLGPPGELYEMCLKIA